MMMGWSEGSAAVAQKCLAQSTWNTYNRMITSFPRFLQAKGSDLSTCSEGTIAEFIEQQAQHSSQPKSRLTHFSAAVACFNQVCGLQIQLTADHRRLLDGLIKTRTTSPLLRSQVMPVAPFQKLFSSWPQNNKLPLDRLRLKALCLFVLCTMSRPSDVAPRSGALFRRTAIRPLEGGALEIYFHHIKNDSDRDGFRVILRLPDSTMCPVDALVTYEDDTTPGEPLHAVSRQRRPSGPIYTKLEHD